MTGDFWGILDRIAKVFTWWVTVTPWEQAIRVQFGRRLRLLGPGVHLKIPLVHQIYKQSVRLRASTLQVQTLTTLDGQTLTVAGILNYKIADIGRLYDTLHHAEDSLRSFALSAIAAYVQGHPAAQCTLELVAQGSEERLEFEQYGIELESLCITDFAFVRTHRLIMDQKWGMHGDSLSTERANVG